MKIDFNERGRAGIEIALVNVLLNKLLNNVHESRHTTSLFNRFFKASRLGDDVVQRVQMLDASGASWLAVYRLQRQKDKLWRISGCAVVENKGRMA